MTTLILKEFGNIFILSSFTTIVNLLAISSAEIPAVQVAVTTSTNTVTTATAIRICDERFIISKFVVGGYRFFKCDFHLVYNQSDLDYRQSQIFQCNTNAPLPHKASGQNYIYYHSIEE